MNDGTEALECVRRCEQALLTMDDVEDGQAVWRLLGVYLRRAKLERAGASMASASPPLRAPAMPVGDAREGIGF